MTDGVLPNPSTNLQVSAGDGMNILVEAGFALCNGCMALEESQRTLAVQASDTNYDRIDTVVLRLNDNDSARTCDLYVLQGVPASTPIRPTLTRTESIWEIGLADLFITPHSSEITNQRITDTRYETERCGVISAISEFDTTTLYNQIQADLVGFKEEEQAQFVEWFDYMKDKLSEDAAGNLQLQINEANEKVGLLQNLTTVVKTSIVDAINWIKEQIDTINNNLANTNKTVSQLNSDIKSCFQSVSDGKAKVASAITAKGISTALDATFDTMAANIGKIKNTYALKVVNVGSTTGNLDVRTVCNNNGIDWTKLTENNFAIYQISGSAASKSSILFGAKVGSGTMTLNAVNPKISGYNASTGILSVSGCSESVQLKDSSGNSAQYETVSRTLTCYIRVCAVV